MFDHWQRFSWLELLFSPLAGALRLLLAPGSRTYWPYLLVSLAVAAVFWYREKQTSPHLPAELDVFSRATWTSQSALNDYALVSINALLFLYFLEALLPSGTRWVPTIAAQLSIGDEPLLSLSPLVSSILLAGTLFVVDDFLRFNAHRLEHRVAFLWELHKVHHSATVLNFVTAERQHPVSLFLTSVLLISGAVIVNLIFVKLFGRAIKPAYWIGANVFWVASNFLASALRHSPVWISFGPNLEQWLISPAQHQIHHSDKPEHFDKNYGSTLAIWDRVFGSLYRTTSTREPLRFGLGAENVELARLRDLYLRPLRRIVTRVNAPRTRCS